LQNIALILKFRELLKKPTKTYLINSTIATNEDFIIPSFLFALP